MGQVLRSKQEKHRVMHRAGTWMVACALILGVMGCSSSSVPDAKPTTGRNPVIAEVPSADETVRGEADPAIVTLNLGSALHERKLAGSEELPGNIIIPTTNLDAVPITAALQAVLAGTDVSLSWDTGKLGDRLVTVMNLSGPLPRVVDKICSAAKVFCAYKRGSIALEEKETFIVSLPPIGRSVGSSSGTGGSSGVVAAGGNTMADAITSLSGDKAHLDEAGGNIIYTTDVEGEDRVRQYLEELRNGRPLVVLQMYIWEVTLDKQNAAGINWSQLSLKPTIPLGPLGTLALSGGASAFTSVMGTTSAPVPGSVSLGAVTTGNLNSNSVVSFLATQGRVQTISNPQITFVSGQTAEFIAGGEQSYVSSVGQLVTSSNVAGTSSPTSTSGVGTNTVNQDKIKTGLTVDVNGTYESGVVFASLSIKLINLISILPAPGGSGVQTPITSNRSINTVIRVRPGDNLVMAGLVTSQDTDNREGIPLPFGYHLPAYNNDKLENNELVVMVKPAVILFSDKEDPSVAKKREEAKPKLEAMYIDGAGSKTLALPAKQETLASASAPLPLQKGDLTPSAPGTVTSPVDSRLMQRGFSDLYDTSDHGDHP